MLITKRLTAILLCALLCAPALPAQDRKAAPQTDQAITQDVLIIIQQQQVRFTAQRAVEEMRLQIFDQSGEMVYDSGSTAGTEIDWPLRQANGEALKSGLYAYTLSIKEAGAETARARRGHFIVDRAGDRESNVDRLWVTSQGEGGVGTELTVARSEENTLAGAVITNGRTMGEGRDGAKREGERTVEANKNKTNDRVELKASAPAAAAGTVGQIAKFTTTTELGDSGIIETGDGNVGVGTTVPLSKLTVRTPTSSYGLTHTDGSIILGTWTGNSSGWFGTWSNHPLHFFTANSQAKMTLDTAGALGIGTTTPSHSLHVSDNKGIRQNRLYFSGGDAWSSLSYNAHHNDTNTGWVFPDPNRPAVTLEMDDNGGAPRFSVFSTTSSNKTNWVQHFGINGNTGQTFINGNVGIKTSSPDRNLTVQGFGGAYLNLKNRSGVFGTFDNQEVLLGADDNGGIVSTMTNHDLQLRAGGNSTKMVIRADGNVGIGTPIPVTKLQVEGGGVIDASVRSIDNQARLSLVSNINGQNRAWGIENGVFFNPGMFGIYDYTADKARLTIDTNGVVGVNTLQITGGSDFSENFDVTTTNSETTPLKIEAGMVVSIDPANPGKLQLSAQAYDRRVAGIISGAGGVKPGMIMSQSGTLADGQYPVALTGRVYCWVDASYGAIEPGDLLTTSTTPGHGMKGTDSAKAQGAIIGKAMTGLKEGKGLALVLVTLQ